MIREKYQTTVVETSFNIVQTRVDSVRRKNITRTGYRAYQDGLIGVYGQLGPVVADPWSKALENLQKNQVTYPFVPASHVRQEKKVPSALDANQIMADLEQVLRQARSDHPDFILSNKVNVTEVTTILENDQDTFLSFSDQVLSVGVVLKHKTSVSIMDAFLGYQSRCWNPARFTSELAQITQAYSNCLDLPDEALPVVAEAGLLARKFVSELNGEKVGYKSSLLAGDFGKKAFHDDFTLYLDWDEQEQYHTPFFDAEGTICANGRIDLIRRGVVEKAYTDKRTAEQFNMPLTGSAACPYDGVPALGARNFNIERSDKSLKSLLNGRPGVFVAMASGGDYTDEGRFATPVQLAFLTDGERLIGRLPEFNLSGDLYELFGKDYVGYANDRFIGDEHMLVVNMKIRKN